MDRVVHLATDRGYTTRSRCGVAAGTGAGAGPEATTSRDNVTCQRCLRIMSRERDRAVRS